MLRWFSHRLARLILASHLPIVEMNLFGAEDLIVLMPLAGDQNRIARRGNRSAKRIAIRRSAST